MNISLYIMLYSVDSVDPEYLPENQTDDPIYVFFQFFIASTSDRKHELKTCLRKNVENKYIDKIILLNERVYSPKELGVKSDKIVQVNIGTRFLFSHVFQYVSTELQNTPAYIVISNSDILFDETLGELRKSSIHKRRILYAQLRHEYNEDSPELSSIASACADAQDSWIFHSNHKIDDTLQRALRFNMGIPGCDNKLVYIANLLGFKVANEPRKIKCFHYHTSNVRNYTAENRIPRPYAVIFPKNIEPLAYDNNSFFKPIENDVSFYDNDVLREFLLKNADTPYTILQVGPESVYVVAAITAHQLGIEQSDAIKAINDISAGIPRINIETSYSYACNYVHAFSGASMYAIPDKRNKKYYESSMLIEHIKCKVNNRCISTHTMEIYNYILSNPWTNALKNTAILIISKQKTLIKLQIEKKVSPYRIPLFEGCTWLVMETPSGENDFLEEMGKIVAAFHRIKDKFKVALVDAGGYSVQICTELAKMQKSSIYVGEWLPLYFGVYNNAWVENRPDVAYNMYVNKQWVNSDAET